MMISTVMAKPVVQYLLRLPPELHEALRQAAEEEDRSLHSLIVHILRQWVNQRTRED